MSEVRVCDVAELVNGEVRTAQLARDAHGRPRFLHSATYGQLLQSNGLSPQQLAARVKQALGRAAGS